jgi:hypothetical protein
LFEKLPITQLHDVGAARQAVNLPDNQIEW